MRPHRLSPLLCALLGCGGGAPERAVQTDAPRWDSGDTGGPGPDGAAPGWVDHGTHQDRDEDGVTKAQGDCDDDNAAVHPEAMELCDGVDDDCDGWVDEACAWPVSSSTDAAWSADGATGWRIAAGDLTGNGFDGVILSEETAAEGGGAVRLLDASGATLLDLEGAPDQGLGRAVVAALASADAHPDLLISAASGGAFLLHGPLTAGVTLDDAHGIALDEEPHRALAANLTGDDSDDLLLATPGQVRVWPGPLRGWFSAADAAIRVEAPPAAAGFGEAAVPTDLNGDGVLDLVIGAPRDSVGASAGGAVYAWLGPLTGTLSAGDAALVLRSGAALDNAGQGLAACDLTSDGAPDLVVGRPGADADGRADAGDVVILDAAPMGHHDLTAAASGRVAGSIVTGALGASVACADLDADGDLDLLTGVLRPEGYGGDGSAAVDGFTGPWDGVITSPALRARGDAPRADWGRRLVALDGGAAMLVGGRSAPPTLLEAALLP